MPKLNLIASAIRLLMLTVPVLSLEAKGISVRFLACPPEDSIVRYEVFRSGTAAGSPQSLGEVAAIAGRDTLVFQDLLAEKGKSYFYSITGINADGVASDPSARTEIGFPLLSLPDTLRPDPITGSIGFVLATPSDPLRGSQSLELSLGDSSRFSIRYDSAARAVVLKPRPGQDGIGRVVVRARYLGKFEDLDSVLIIAAKPLGPTAIGPARGVRAGHGFPGRYSPRTQGTLMLEGLPGPGSLEIFSLMGVRSASLRVAGPGARLAWDGKDRFGAYLKPARYLWTMRGPGGNALESGTFLIVP